MLLVFCSSKIRPSVLAHTDKHAPSNDAAALNRATTLNNLIAEYRGETFHTPAASSDTTIELTPNLSLDHSQSAKDLRWGYCT
jgi:hypothetical protein